MNTPSNKRKPLRRVFQIAFIIVCLVGLYLWTSGPKPTTVSVLSERSLTLSRTETQTLLKFHPLLLLATLQQHQVKDWVVKKTAVVEQHPVLPWTTHLV